ncbi:MAG: thiamine phosphate synthase, partial [Burkholderiales bacterium]
ALGPAAIIGVSCYDNLAAALEAQSRSADYVAFGSFFDSPTKPHAVRVPLALLGEARQKLHVPVVAIGGIRPQNARALIERGAHAVAVLSALFDTTDTEAVALSFKNLFELEPASRRP